jgi:hypothetical protein
MRIVSLRKTGSYMAISLAAFMTLTALILGGPKQASAQQATAQITGTIRDASHAIVVGAKVTLRNTDTNIAKVATSNKDGDYLFTLIPIGTYELSVEQTGFSKYVRKGITLVINQNAKQDVDLKVGTSSQVVEVNGNVTQVDTISATLGKVETTQRIETLPLAARDTLQLGLLQAGVFAPDQDDGSGNQFSVSGQRSESMTFLLDGADNTDFLGNNIVVNPSPDAVAEFKIITNNYEAEYGRTSGGVVNQVIKSGTNALHGSLFDYFRNTALDTKDFFTDQVPVYKYNIFGGTAAFPILKDKMFFFASYQGQRKQIGQSQILTVLSPNERTGDFSELGTQLTNPVTGGPFKCKGKPCNQVPVDTVMQNYIKNFVPLPNAPFNQFVEDPIARLQADQFIFRYDYTISPKDTLSATYIFDDDPDNYPVGPLGGNVPVGSGYRDNERAQNGSIQWTRTISPTMLNELRATANRIASLGSIPTDTTPPSALGFTTVIPDDPKGAAPPYVGVSGAFALGPSPYGPTKTHDAVFQYMDTFSWTHGRHAMKFGADMHWVRDNFDYDFFNNGSFDYGNYYPNTGSALADFVGGYTDNYFQFSNATYNIRTHQLDFFAQDAWKITRRLSLDYGVRYEYNSPQEDLHNEILGWFPGQQSTVYPDAPPDILYPRDPGTPNRGLAYPDRNNFAPRFGFAWDMLGNAKLVMRGGFGVFYDIEDGALNLQFGGEPPFGYGANNYPCFTTKGKGASTGCLEPVNGSYSADPFQTANTGYSDPYPFIAGGHLGQFFNPEIPFAYVVTPRFRTPYAEHVNYGFQYQVTKDTMIEAVYVGSFSRKAIAGQNYNYPTLGGPNGLMAQYQYYVSQGIDPDFGITADCARPLAACNGSPAFTGNPTGATQILTNVSEGSSSSNELQVTVDREVSHGLQFRVAYTYGKTMDQTSGFRTRSSVYTNPLDPAFDRGLADFDATHRLVLSPIWEIPFGNHGSGLRKTALGGWEVSTITSFQSGNPFTLFSNNGASFSNGGLDRPDVIGPVPIFHNPRQLRTFTLPNPAVDPLHLSCVSANGTDNSGNPTVTGLFYFDPTNLVCAPGPPVGQTVPAGSSLVQGGVPLFTYGNMGRNVLRGPGINNWDISLMKNFQFTENKNLQFQGNLFNAFNHTQFFSPTLGAGAIGGTSTFGQVTSDSTAPTSTYYRGPRVVQFALRFSF